MILSLVYLILTGTFIFISVVEFYDFLVKRSLHNLFECLLALVVAVLMFVVGASI